VFWVETVLDHGLFYVDAHRAGRACDYLHRLLEVVGIEVGHLLFRNFFELRLRERAYLGGIGLAAPLLFADCLEDKGRDRRGLEDKVV